MTAAIRKIKLAKVHIAKTQLGLDDDDYLAILKRITCKASSRDCSSAELDRLEAEFKRLGWKPKKTAKGGGKTLPPSTKPYIRLVHALWKSCQRKGLIEDGSRTALRVFVKKRAGVDDPDFLTFAQANPIIDALKAMEARG